MAETADSTAPVNDPAPTEGSDPAPEATEAPAEAPAEGSQEAAETEVSMADAFAEAQRELAGEQDASTTERGEDGSAAEELDAELGEADAESGESSEEQTGQADETSQESATSDQIAAMREKVANGRFNELTYEERQLWEDTQGQVKEQQQLWENIRDGYLRLKSLRAEDPDAFLQEMEQNPGRWDAFKKFEQQYPNISEEAPTPQRSEQEIRQEIDNKYASTINETVKQAATEAGLSEAKFNELVQQHGNRLGSLMVETMKQAAEQSANARLEKQLEQRVAEERDAIRKEIEVEYANRNQVRFPSGGSAKDPSTREPSNEPMTIQQAFKEAQAELEQRAS